MPTPQSEYSIRERNRIACAKYKDAHPDRVRASTYKWRDANLESFKEYQKRRVFRIKYGITLEERDAIFLAQGSKCAICQVSENPHTRQWHTDHCHATNTVRGVLCHNCNLMLGQAKDDPERLRAAIAYLERSVYPSSNCSAGEKLT